MLETDGPFLPFKKSDSFGQPLCAAVINGRTLGGPR